MEINLLKLNYENNIKINEEIVIPEDYYQNTDILSLSKIKVQGIIKLDMEENYDINLEIQGEMELNDALTNEKVSYPFTSRIEETLENSLKTLDLIEFLWHYIVLEVPIRFTKSEMVSIENENYRLISEEEYRRKNNPFSDFKIE